MANRYGVTFITASQFWMVLHMLPWLRSMGFGASYWPHGGERPDGVYVPVTHDIALTGDPGRIETLIKALDWSQK